MTPLPDKLMAARPYANNDAFLAKLAELAPGVDGATRQRRSLVNQTAADEQHRVTVAAVAFIARRCGLSRHGR